MNTSTHPGGHSIRPPHLHHVSALKPFIWLRKGWNDLLHHPTASLTYGVIVCALGALILGYSQHPYTVAVAMSGFMFVGPIMAAGLCELSRQQSRGEKTNFGSSLKTLRSHRRNLLRYASVLLGISLLWFGLSRVMLYEAFGSIGPSLSDTIWGNVFDTVSYAQIFAYVIIGTVLACVVFILSIVTVPMIIDRNSGAIEAMHTSTRVALAADTPAMIVWGAMCLLLVGFGFATFLVGMVVVFPLLGHASWHAYQDLVEKQNS